jgi:hypothetical protein
MRPKGFQCTIDEREYDRINGWIEVIDIIDDKKTFHKILENPVPSKETHVEPVNIEPIKEPDVITKVEPVNIEPIKEPDVITKPAEGVTKPVKKKTSKNEPISHC